MSGQLIVLLTAAAPISEIRGALPLAIGVFHFPVITAFTLSVLGNIAPVLPLLLFWRYASEAAARHSQTLSRLFEGIFARTRRHDKTFERWGLIGLAIFVAIPLPGTGAWTASAAAFLLGFPLLKSFFAISLGVIGAGLIMLALTLGAISIF